MEFEFTIENQSLGLSVRKNIDNLNRVLLDNGLASQSRYQWSISRIWTSSTYSQPLQEGGPKAAAQAAAFFFLGMTRWWLIAAALALLAVVSGILSFFALAIALTLLLLSVVIHELGHVVAFRAFARPSSTAYVVSRGFNCSLIRRAIPNSAELLIVTAGPIAPLLFSFAFLPFLIGPVYVFWFWLALSAGHVMSLFIPVGDGLNFILALRRKRTRAHVK